MESLTNPQKKVPRHVDGEVSSYIKEAYKKATEIMKEKIEKLHTMAEALLKFETIDSKEVDMIMDGKKMEDILSYRKQVSETLKKEQDEYKEKLKKKKIAKKASSVDDGSSTPLPSPV